MLISVIETDHHCNLGPNLRYSAFVLYCIDRGTRPKSMMPMINPMFRPQNNATAPAITAGSSSGALLPQSSFNAPAITAEPSPGALRPQGSLTAPAIKAGLPPGALCIRSSATVSAIATGLSLGAPEIPYGAATHCTQMDPVEYGPSLAPRAMMPTCSQPSDIHNPCIAVFPPDWCVCVYVCVCHPLCQRVCNLCMFYLS